MSAGEYLEGLVFFAGTVGSVLVAAGLIVRRRLRHLDLVESVLALAVVATLCLIGVHLLPGLFGLLSRTSVLLVAVAVAILATRIRPIENETGAAPPRPLPASGRASWAIAGVAIGLVAVASVAAAWRAAATPTVEIDSLQFHLPNIARWIQTGSFWQIDVLAPLQPTGHYPHNGDVVIMSAVLPWRNDAFARLVDLPFTAVAALAVYAIATELGARRATGALVAAVYSSLPIVVAATFVGTKTDPVLLAGFGSGLLFLMRHFRTGLPADLALAGLGFGLALGTKWYGVTAFAAVLASWAGLWLLARLPPRELARNGAVLLGLVAAAGGFWLVRNLVESGNPVFPIEVAALGVELFHAPRDVMRECGGFAIADYLGDLDIWRDYYLPAYRDRLALPGLACLIAWLLALGLFGVPRLRQDVHPRGAGAVPLMLAVTVALLVVAYSLTPYTALGPEGMPSGVISNVRWLGPAFLVAAALAGWVVARLDRARLVAELALLVAVVDGVIRGFDDPPRPVVGAAVAVGATAIVGYLLFRRPSPRALVGLAAAALAVLALAGYQRQQTFNEGRYMSQDPTLAWIARHAPADTRVGLAGPWETVGISPVTPAFGPHFRNEVDYVGPFVDELLLEYPTRDAFLRAVDRGRYELLLIGKADYRRSPPRECLYRGYGTDENAWARRAGYRELAESDRLVLYRVQRRARGGGA